MGHRWAKTSIVISGRQQFDSHWLRHSSDVNQSRCVSYLSPSPDSRQKVASSTRISSFWPLESNSEASRGRSWQCVFSQMIRGKPRPEVIYSRDWGSFSEGECWPEKASWPTDECLTKTRKTHALWIKAKMRENRVSCGQHGSFVSSGFTCPARSLRGKHRTVKCEKCSFTFSDWWDTNTLCLF